MFVDGRRCRVASRTVPAEARLRLYLEPPAAPPTVPVLYEDEACVVVAKPAGIAVNKTDSTARVALAELRGLGPDLRVVHRLDQGTTGVLLLAKGPAAAAALSKAFAEREVDKRYLALVEGSPGSGPIEAPIGPDRRRPRARAVRTDGQPARTDLAQEFELDGLSWVQARPITGRTHQIRVHLAHVGAPIVGDILYGGPSAVRLSGEAVRIARPLLHAARISLQGPAGPIDVEAPLPDDLRDVLRRWKGAVAEGIPPE